MKSIYHFVTALILSLNLSLSHASSDNEAMSSYEHYLKADEYINAKNGEYNSLKAFSHLLKAVYEQEQRHPKAVHELGLMYHYWPMWNQFYNGSFADLIQRFKQMILGYRNDFFLNIALGFYHEAAQMGNPESFSSIGMMYLNGESVRPNIVKAYQYFSIGDYLGDPISSSYMQNIKEHIFIYQLPSIDQFKDTYLKENPQLLSVKRAQTLNSTTPLNDILKR